MRALSLHQPWAGRLAAGRKWIETRPRRSPWHVAVGQTIAVHSTIKLVRDARACFRLDDCFCPDADDAAWLDHIVAPYEVATLCSVHGDELAYGALIATAHVIDVVPIVESFSTVTDAEGNYASHVTCGYDDDPTLRLWIEPFALDGPGRDIEDQRPYGTFEVGRWAILFDDIMKLPHPIETRGYQGLWTIPPEIATQIGAP